MLRRLVPCNLLLKSCFLLGFKLPYGPQASGAAAAAAQMVEVDAALAETAVGLQRLLTGRHLPTLRRWLDVFSRVGQGLKFTLRRVWGWPCA